MLDQVLPVPVNQYSEELTKERMFEKSTLKSPNKNLETIEMSRVSRTESKASELSRWPIPHTMQCITCGWDGVYCELRQVAALAGWDHTELHETLTDQI